MNREQAKKVFHIIKAFTEDKTIQYKAPGLGLEEWSDLTDSEGLPVQKLSEEPDNFRIKPKLKYHPFKDVNECLREIQKHSPLGWIKKLDDGHYSLITSIDDDKLGQGLAISGHVGWTFSSTYREYTFADGTPFGIKEEKF